MFQAFSVDEGVSVNQGTVVYVVLKVNLSEKRPGLGVHGRLGAWTSISREGDELSGYTIWSATLWGREDMI